MPGIARSRRQPGIGSSASRSTRPAATSAAARRSVSARAGARSIAASCAGAVAATRSGGGASRSPVPGSRVPRTAIIRRWIAIARSNSISCSRDRRGERLPGQRRAADPEVGHGPDRLADDGVVAEGVVERAQVLVDAGGEPQPPDPPHRVGLRARAGAEDDPVGRGLDDGDVDRVAVLVQQPLERGAAAARQAVGRAAAQAERPAGSDLDAQLVHGRFISRGAAGCSGCCRVLHALRDRCEGASERRRPARCPER